MLFAALLLAVSPALADEPSVTGQTGLISMPDARFAPEGSWRTGLSFMRPYQSIWSGVTIFPWLETSFRYTRIYHVPGFPGRPNEHFGDFKDKAFDAKLLVLPERGIWPGIAAGAQDIAGGTGIFRAPYAVASKRFGELDLSAGYGGRRIDGVFGGVRWSPAAASNWSLVAEYDAFNYKRDPFSELSGAASYKKEPAVGVEYHREWFGVKAFSSHGHLGFNTYINVALEQREFVPKLDEPAPYTRINPRPTEAQWEEDSTHRARLARALVEQDFRDIRIGYSNGRLDATLTNTRISSMPRAVGRAARTLLSFAPLEVREIRITYEYGTLPLATYTFINVPLLQRYFNGMASRDRLAPYVAIQYARPEEAREQADRGETLTAFEEPLPQSIAASREGLDIVGVRGTNILGGRGWLHPGISTYLNDPSGAFKLELDAVGNYDRYLGRQTFLQAEARLVVYENVSDVTQPSNSLLPHVRTDIAEYKRAAKFKLTRLQVNKFSQPAERVYGRLSAGIYEEMYSGFGGQVLYLPRDGGWGVDFDANWLKQRDFEGWFGYRPYSTVTAIGSLNYRLSKGLTATLRTGRFLAKDEGVRAEMKRRFASGFEVGAWYSVTNGNDITTPGSPSSPYHDKGIFMAIPIEPLLTRDTQGAGVLALAPWTRDVGQMVNSPGDLFSILERPLVQMHDRDGLVRFGDRDDDYALPSLGTGRDRIWPDLVADDFFSAGPVAGQIDWMRTALLGGGLILGSAALDNRAFRFADRHKDSRVVKEGVRVGNALPIAALGLSGLFALDDSRPRLANAGVAALEAGALAFVGVEGLKYAVGRARPAAGLGRSEFETRSSEDRFHSFPSRHTALMWAAVTPYAKEFGMPWLYGAAAITNAARVGSREHWLSDTVGGSVIGYALGSLAWEARRESARDKSAPKLAVGPGGAALAWELP
ncbi:MAG TPA: YjbH domain-containing protein [Burkholderiales bacterium]|nr:YjbH domain-containing protein [Burkholderiales bacterium]